MKIGAVPSSWMSITNAWSAKVNLNLLEEVNRRGIAHDDLPAVEAVWQEMKQQAVEADKHEKSLAAKRCEEAQESQKKLKDIKAKFPGLGNKRGDLGY